MNKKGDQLRVLSVGELFGSSPEKIQKDCLYNTLSKYQPSNELDYLSLAFYIESIVDFAVQGRHGFELLDIFSAMVQNPVLSPIYYQLDIAKFNRLKLDPRLEQIIDYYESFRPTK